MSDSSSKQARKLAAILHADIAGYSRLMGQDESGTHVRLKAHRRVVEDTIARHNGRIVGTAGDAVLADFASVADALSAATAVQTELATRNAELSQEKRLEFRIGINLGDVIVDGEDIFGNGVNVAARIEALAEPGGISISGSVYDQVSNDPNLVFRDCGAHNVKNISQPIRVYALSNFGDGGPLSRSRPRTRKLLLAAAAVAIVVAGTTVVWLQEPINWLFDQPRHSSTSPSTIEDFQLGKPTIAVLPFEDRSGDPEQSYFSDGLTEDVIIDLGRFSGLLVLSWSAVAPYGGQSIEPERLHVDLNVDYLVTGSVRRAADRLRITVQLTDARDGVLLWSERYDTQLAEIFSIQDQISQKVVGALAVRVTRLEEERAFDKPTENLNAYDHLLRGRELLRRSDRSSNLAARAQFERAAIMDERYADARIDLGWTHMYDFLYGWTEWPGEALDRAEKLASETISLSESNASAHALLANILRFRGQFERSEKEIIRALTLNPNNAMSHAIHGSLMVWWGKSDDAIEPLELALRLDPYPHTWWLVNLAQAYYFQGRFNDVVSLMDRFQVLFEEEPGSYAILAAAHGQLGHMDQAAMALKKLERISPFFDAPSYASNFADPHNGAYLLEGLAKAGLK